MIDEEWIIISVDEQTVFFGFDNEEHCCSLENVTFSSDDLLSHSCLPSPIFMTPCGSCSENTYYSPTASISSDSCCRSEDDEDLYSIRERYRTTVGHGQKVMMDDPVEEMDIVQDPDSAENGIIMDHHPHAATSPGTLH